MGPNRAHLDRLARCLTAHSVEIFLLIACVAPFLLLPNQQVLRLPPDIALQPAGELLGPDNAVVARNAWQWATGERSVFDPVGPYLRVLIPGVVIWLTGTVVEHSLQTSIVAYATIVVVFEGLLAPLALYMLTRTVHSRRAGLAVLSVTALFQTQLYPWHAEHLVAPILQVFASVLGFHCHPCTPDLISGSMFLGIKQGHFWMYALPSVPMVLSVFFVTERVRDRTVYAPVFGGLFLGMVGSLQLAMAFFLATAIATALVWQRAWRALLVTGGTAMVVSSPELVSALSSTGDSKMMAMGIERLNVPRASALVDSPLVKLAIVVSLVAIVVALAYGPRYAERTTVASRVDWALVFWLVVPLSFWVVARILGADWYRMYASYTLKYAIFYWIGLGVVRAARRLTRYEDHVPARARLLRRR